MEPDMTDLSTHSALIAAKGTHAYLPSCDIEVVSEVQVPPVDWDEIIRAMELSAQQRSRMLLIRRSYLAAVRQLLTDRQAILHQIQVTPSCL